MRKEEKSKKIDIGWGQLVGKGNIIEIKKPVQIEQGEDIITLEKGDKVEVLKENVLDDMSRRAMKANDELIDALTDINDHTGAALIDAIFNNNVKEAEKLFQRWLKRERQGYL